MKILFPVSYLPGDTEDDNHIRVEHHHSEGLTNTTCIINGEAREVRSTSRVCVAWVEHKAKTILVHLKPRKRLWLPRMQCKTLSTASLLRYIELTKGNRAMLLMYYPNIGDSWSVPKNLINAKLRKLVKQGFLQNYWHHKAETPLNLTPKAYQYMEQTNA